MANAKWVCPRQLKGSEQMKKPAALQIVPIGDKCLVRYFTEAERKAFLNGEDNEDTQMTVKVYTMPEGFELANIFVDIQGGGTTSISAV